MGLQRELGLSLGRIRDAAPIAWANGLTRRQLFGHPYDGSQGRDIRHFVLDAATESFLYTTFEMDGYGCKTVRYACNYRRPGLPLPKMS